MYQYNLYQDRNWDQPTGYPAEPNQGTATIYPSHDDSIDKDGRYITPPHQEERHKPGQGRPLEKDPTVGNTVLPIPKPPAPILYLMNKNQEKLPSSNQLRHGEYDKVKRHPRFGKFQRLKDSNLWISKDQAGHGGSAWKLFEEKGGSLQWVADLDKGLNIIQNKHKGNIGKDIPVKDLHNINFKNQGGN